MSTLSAPRKRGFRKKCVMRPRMETDGSGRPTKGASGHTHRHLAQHTRQQLRATNASHTLNKPPRLPPRMEAPMIATERNTIAQTPSAAASSVPLPKVLRSV